MNCNIPSILSAVSHAVYRTGFLIPGGGILQHPCIACVTFVRSKYTRLDLPKPGDGKQYRFRVDYPEDEKYTVVPLKTRKLGGRDPETGRVIVGTLGGGNKRRYRWIDIHRVGPTEGPPSVERVIHIQFDPMRSANLALTASGNQMRYRTATVNMKPGDILKTSGAIPRIPVRPVEGDAHPLGALPLGTQVCCVERFPGDGQYYGKAAGTFVTIIRKVGSRVIVKLPSKHEVSLDKYCMGTIGRVSRPYHGSLHIGSAQRARWLGFRPKSGLWHRKDGYCGRKIRPLPPVRVISKKEDEPHEILEISSKFA